MPVVTNNTILVMLNDQQKYKLNNVFQRIINLTSRRYLPQS